jgi:hypothetical protein
VAKKIINRPKYDDMQGHLFKLTESERHILKTIGGGSYAEGVRICIMWGAHFYNLGLTTEMDLKHIGLVTVSTTDNYPHE